MTIEQARKHMAAAHEAAHAVAAHILGIDLDKVEIDSAGGSFTRVAKSSRPVLADPSSVFDYAIVLLSGGAYLRSCGIKRGLDDSDFTKAVWLVQNGTESKAAARAGFDVCLESAQALVESSRFQTLCACLTPVLAKESWHWGLDVLRFLRENDPERPSTVRHSGEPRYAPWYEVTDRDKRLLYKGADEAEAKRVQRLHPHSMMVGSVYS